MSKQPATPSDLSRIIHDFRTPAIAILTFADQVVEQLADSVEIVQRIHSIRDNAEYILDLAASILAGNQPDESTEAPITLIPDTIYQLRAPAAAKQVDLQICAEQDVPQELPIPPLHLKQLLYNLIGNSVRYAPGGSVRVSIERYQRHLHQDLNLERITAPSHQAVCVLSIQDSGPGIPADLAAAINGDPQAIITHTTGLGLYICHRLARMAGWVFQATPLADGGSLMQLACAVPTEVTWEPLPRLSYTDALIAKVPVVVIDNQTYRQLALAALLKSEGHQVLLWAEAENNSIKIDQALTDCRIAFISADLIERGLDRTIQTRGFSGKVIPVSEHPTEGAMAMPFHHDDIKRLMTGL